MPRSFDAPVTRSELSNRIDPGLDVYKHSDVTKGLSEMDQLVLGIAVKKANDDFWKDRLNNAESRQDLERLVSEIVRDARKNGDAEEALQVWKKTVFVLFKEAGETVQALRYIERYLEELHERVRDLKEPITMGTTPSVILPYATVAHLGHDLNPRVDRGADWDKMERTAGVLWQLFEHKYPWYDKQKRGMAPLFDLIGLVERCNVWTVRQMLLQSNHARADSSCMHPYADTT
ncbi:hypothetical protein JCM16303_000353 [Sporobolomyces ruberrimus]